MALLARRWMEVRAFDATLQLQGYVIGPSSDGPSASFTAYHNGVSTGNVTLPVDHKMVTVLLQPGMRLQFRYLQEGGTIVEQMSGPIVASAAGMNSRGATETFTAVSDDIFLRNLGWPVPTASLAAQTLEYDTNTGAVDAVVYDMVRDAFTRLGSNITVIPLFPSGPTVTIKSRFNDLAEVAYAALEAANYGIKMYQWNPGDPVPFFLSSLAAPTILVDIGSPSDRTYVKWTPLLGIAQGTASTEAPTVTRVVVGGQGEGTARTFLSVIDTTLETAWGFIREKFVDARDATDTATMTQRANEALAEGAPRGSLSVTTIDGEPWIVGVDYNRGDRVRIAAVTGEVISTEVVRSITFSVSGSEGVTVTPQIGDPSSTSDPDAAIGRILRSLGSRLNALEARR